MRLTLGCVSYVRGPTSHSAVSTSQKISNNPFSTVHTSSHILVSWFLLFGPKRLMQTLYNVNQNCQPLCNWITHYWTQYATCFSPQGKIIRPSPDLKIEKASTMCVDVIKHERPLRFFTISKKDFVLLNIFYISISVSSSVHKGVFWHFLKIMSSLFCLVAQHTNFDWLKYCTDAYFYFADSYSNFDFSLWSFGNSSLLCMHCF